MLSFVYNIALFIYLVVLLPKICYEKLFLGKNREKLFYRLGIKKHKFDIPIGAYVVWLHAVSLGETKSSISYMRKIKLKIQNAFIIISSTTKTGHSEAKKNLSFADKHIYMPFDFSWVFSKIFKTIKPNLVIIIETDFWLNFLKKAKHYGAKVIVISGKISKKSQNLYCKVKFFSKALFSYVDIFCVQNEEYKNRWMKIGINTSKIKVTGNLKYSAAIQLSEKPELDKYRSLLAIQDHHNVITIASTHHPEEKWMVLDNILPLIDKFNLKVMIAPRHPERFLQVQETLSSCSITTISDIEKGITTPSNIILIDRMGFLPICYQMSDIAIVGGSYEGNLGGHNVLEPLFYNTPVFFGPYMYSQKDLRSLVMRYNCGMETTKDKLRQEIEKYFSKTSVKTNLQDNISTLKKSLNNVLDSTWEVSSKYFQ
jgi:3-deoxy-D-manno-octulosonic-acid transferase